MAPIIYKIQHQQNPDKIQKLLPQTISIDGVQFIIGS